MFIKQIQKRNSSKGKIFKQYQLTETYRVDGKVKHHYILYLGYNKLLEDKPSRQIVAKLIESRITGNLMISEQMLDISGELIGLADDYYLKYLQKNSKEQTVEPEKKKEEKIEYDSVDTSSAQVFDCREIGAESISYEMLERIGLRDFLKKKAWSDKMIDYALISIISRAVFRSSEHKTEKWLKHNSGLKELFDKKIEHVSRHHLYKASKTLYAIKDALEVFFYERLTGMFEMKDNIFIYDLTNTYFEGRKIGSEKAKFGRSKEKRYDCKQIVLAAVVNEHGFLKHSRIYEGNMSDPSTLIDIVSNLNRNNSEPDKQATVVIDAGIATEDNLDLLRKQGYLYVCVSRSKPKERPNINLDEAIEIKDRKDGKIKLKFVDVKDKKDKWLYVKSEEKTKKEDSMLEKSLQRYELELQTVSEGVKKKGGTKKAEKVWERIGRIKERNRKAHGYYDINIKTKGDIVDNLSWKRKSLEPKQRSGEYYLRTNHVINSEEKIWNIYNTIREVESTFRCLKTDLNLRPVYHQTDDNVEAHLHLALLAYQIVAPIRHILKSKGMSDDWQNIVRVMNTQKAVSVSLKAKDDKEIIIRTCSRPIQPVLQIYKALNMSSMPFGKRKFVVPHQKKLMLE